MDSSIRKIHFVGVGGTGTGTFAVALSENGYQVSGSDKVLYEPMKSVLASAQVSFIEGFSAQTVERVQPDLVLIGNVVSRDNPEARAWIQKGVPFVSFPEAVRRLLIQDKTSVVCAGTHGKTTTTSWTAFLLRELGRDPSYLIGGVPQDLPRGCALTQGDVFVGEGDEYDSAFFDKGPKFLHYNPHFLILANVEFDHADIYRDLAHVKSAFEKLVALLPGDGLCIARYDDANVMEVVQGALCPIQTFGVGPGAMWRLGKVIESENGFEFEVIYKGRTAGVFQTPLFGEHNLLNLLSGIICAVNLGVSIDDIRPITARFNGVRRRQEILLKEPFYLVDDFAHHPTEVRATLTAVRRRRPKGTLWAFFEPRSATSRRNVLQDEYAKAFDSADRVLIAEPFRAQTLQEGERFSSDVLVASLTEKGKIAASFPHTDAMVEEFKKNCQPGDTIVVMSNGEFDKIQGKLLNVRPSFRADGSGIPQI